MRTRTASPDLSGIDAPVAHPGVYPWIVRVAGGLAAVLAIVAFGGWIAGAEAFIRWQPDFYPIMPLTIVGHLVAGATLLLLGLGPPARWLRRVAAVIMGLVALVGAFTLVQYLLRIDVGLGRILFPDAVRAVSGPRAGAPALNSGTGFLAAGLSMLLLLLVDGARTARVLASQILALVVLAVGMLALLGYAFAVEELYTVGPYAPMSVPSAVAFLALGLGLLFVRPDGGFMRVVTADDAGGYAARRLLPAAIIVPFALGWLRMLGQEAGLYGTRYGLTLMVGISAVLLAAITGWSALVLRRFDAARERHTARLDVERGRLHAIVDTLPVGVIVADPDGRFTLVNDAFWRIWGAGAPLAERMEDFERYPAWWPGTDRRIRAEEWGLARALRTGTAPAPQEYDIEAFDGERKTILSYIRPTRNGSGRLTGFVVAIVDITERRRAESERERARAEAERRARDEEALRVATAAVAAAFTPEQVIDQVARSALTATEADVALVERIDSERGEAVIVAAAGESPLRSGARMRYAGALVERVINAGEPIVIDELLADSRTPEHLERAFGDSAALAIPMAAPGEPIGTLILIRWSGREPFRSAEIERATTFANLASVAFHKVRLLDASEARRAELRRVLESQSRLVRGFSHDVKNPLGAADGRLALLEDGVVDGMSPPQREEIANARRSLHTALRLISSLVDFARAEAGQLEVEHRPTDVAGIAREIAEEQSPVAHDRGLSLDVDVSRDLEPLRADPDRLRQILGNLVSNAIKYTDEGGVRIRVSERARPDSRDREAERPSERPPSTSAPGPRRWIAIDIIDTGSGIPEDKRDEIFDEFTRLEPDEGHGAGLGLAISRRLARMLGGDITVESEVGAGSTFTIWLPREAGAGRVDDEAGETDAVDADAERPPRAADGGGVRPRDRG